ncbi:Transmembrane protein 230 [Liparis tanakae]|uniref:Transmembrane protein 230 n=1 Tax=Liparis tanakae TaxID=230148 RepID=A0A4Z2G0M3_9TELE|nr:Transmembrane protein 230 [Liparis tanakae]
MCYGMLRCVTFKKSPPAVPYKAIALAIFLFVIGSLLIIFGALLLSGTIKVEVSLGRIASIGLTSRSIATAVETVSRW